MTEDEIRDLFRQMREEPVPADSLARVRMRLGDRIHRRGRWQVASWAMACAVVVLAALLTQPRTVTRKPARAQVAAVRPSIEPQPMAVRPAIQKRVRRSHPAIRPVTIRIETADPDVVILLVGND